MKILHVYKYLDNFIDFDAFHRRDRVNSLRAAYIALMLIFWISMCLIDSVRHFQNHNFNAAAKPFGMLCAVLAFTPLFLQFLINHDRCILLLDHFERIVNESMFESYTQYCSRK